MPNDGREALGKKKLAKFCQECDTSVTALDTTRKDECCRGLLFLSEAFRRVF